MLPRARFLASLAALLFVGPALARQPLAEEDLAKIAPSAWRAFTSGQPQRLLVLVTDPLPLPRPHERSGRPSPGIDERVVRLREAALAQTKARVLAVLEEPRLLHAYPRFRSLALIATVDEALALAAHPEVEWIEADGLVFPAVSSSVPFVGRPDLLAAQPGATGAGTSVAVLDSPVQYGSGFFGDCPAPGAPGCSVRVVENFTDEDPTRLAERTEHGSNVAGIVLAVAPRASILSLNVFRWDEARRRAYGHDADILAALDWVAENRTVHSIVAANLSLGSDRTNPDPCDQSSYADAFLTLRRQGVLCVVAAGNDGLDNALGYPACATPAVAVGAQHDAASPGGDHCLGRVPLPGELACFSNRSGALDLIAPGVNVDAGGVNGASGTSMAAPHVAGAIAALQSLRPPGERLDAFWLQQQLMLWAVPRLDRDWTFLQLNLDPRLAPGVGPGFAAFARSHSAAGDVLTVAGSSYAISVEQGPDAFAGVYLYLEVAHPMPEAVEVSLLAPSGASASFTLPSGRSNFSGLVNRSFPVALHALAGSPTVGTWILRVSDHSGLERGRFHAAVLYLVQPGCVPQCSAERCGDDGCGGACPACIIDARCYPAGAANPEDGCQECDPLRAPSAWTLNPSKPCDDGNLCTSGDTCSEGACRGQLMACPSDDCRALVGCDPRVGCVYENIREGQPCDDADRCTTGDRCQLGVCTGTPVVCDPVCAVADSCDPETGRCAPAAEGAACDDGNLCTRKDVCRGGVCEGQDPVPCGEPDRARCESERVCDPATGTCVARLKDGAPCDDGDPCTIEDGCRDGACVGARRECESSACSVGRCDEKTGACVQDSLPDGTPCEHGTCRAGRCRTSGPFGCSCGAGGEPAMLALLGMVAWALRPRSRAERGGRS